MSEPIMSPEGRLVQGHPMAMSGKGFQGKPLTDKSGSPREECFFAVAFPKTNPLVNTIMAQLHAIAQAGFPGGQSTHPTFSWKVKDGDQPPYNSKEGFPGHMVISFKNGFMPKVFTRGGAQQIVEKSQLKCGDYVRVNFSVAPNGDLAKPGIYINPSVVELIGYGQEIISGPDGSVFAAAPAALPPGASETPVGGGNIAAPGLLGAPAAPGLLGAPAAPGLPAGVIPNAAILNPTPPPSPTPTVPMPPTMTAAAEGRTYQSFIDMGWSREQVIAGGFAVDEVPF